MARPSLAREGAQAEPALRRGSRRAGLLCARASGAGEPIVAAGTWVDAGVIPTLPLGRTGDASPCGGVTGDAMAAANAATGIPAISFQTWRPQPTREGFLSLRRHRFRSSDAWDGFKGWI